MRTSFGGRHITPLSNAELVDLEQRAHRGALTPEQQWRLMEEVQRLRLLPGSAVLPGPEVRKKLAAMQGDIESARAYLARVEDQLDGVEKLFSL